MECSTNRASDSSHSKQVLQSRTCASTDRDIHPGATSKEVALAMPGDEFIERPTFNVATATTI
ncbi:MAG TPA: hypothetical protein VKU38_11845 [Ktedonobacteraceae bacterium]|nr:hypothetical protein [Ktedonobacteraceae bacterium]